MAIRDEWVLPLVERIGELERENGAIVERITSVSAERNQAMHDRMVAERERDGLRAELDCLRAAQDAVTAREVGPGAAELGAAASPSSQPPRPWWRRWFGLG